MSTTRGTYCPVWCEEFHIQKTPEDDFTVHWKGFGNLPGEDESLVRIWVAYEGNNKYSSGAEVASLETYYAEDIRGLARDCLQAAEWMEKNLVNISDHPLPESA